MRSGGIELLNVDCLEYLKTIPDASIDLMLTDPPYGITQNDWDKPINLAEMWLEWERVVKPNGAFVFTSNQPFSSQLILSRQGFFKYEWIWLKEKGVGHLNANKMPMKSHETVLVFYRELPTYNPQKEKRDPYKRLNVSKTKLNKGNYGKTNDSHSTISNGERFPQSVLFFESDSQRFGSIHPTQKPVDLFRYLIRTYSNPGETVFDGYSGSGTTAEACIIEGRKFVGCELNKEYYDKSVDRLSISLSKPQLFLQ